MVSLQASISPQSRKRNREFDNNLSNKRKLEEIIEGHEETSDKRPSSKSESTKSIFDIELQLETPLPFEWERCLNIQSGEIHFYNTRTHKKTTGDPRESLPEPQNPAEGHMSLDLELNLGDDLKKKYSGDLPRRCPSWLAVEGDQQEMVATACMRCHMLVMLCKSSPTCPNCKFLHPPDQSPPKMFKQGLAFCASKDQIQKGPIVFNFG